MPDPNPPGGPAAPSEAAMQRLMEEARRVGDPRRIGTLERLVIACDDVASGAAYKMAKTAGYDPLVFDPHFVRLNSRVVEQYVRMRQRTDSMSIWPGPVATTIRADEGLREYVRLRADEAKRPSIRPPRGRRSRQLADIVNAVGSITDQSILRAALEEGKRDKAKLDILLHALRQLPGIDVEVLLGRRVGQASTSAGPPDQKDVQVLRKLLTRLQDNRFLSDMGLICRNGRVKMDMPPGDDLILPEELALLSRLAGLGPELAAAE